MTNIFEPCEWSPEGTSYHQRIVRTMNLVAEIQGKRLQEWLRIKPLNILHLHCYSPDLCSNNFHRVISPFLPA